MWDNLALFSIFFYTIPSFIFSAHYLFFPTNHLYPSRYLVNIPGLGPFVYIISFFLCFYTVSKVACSFQFMADNILLMFFVFWDLMTKEMRVGQTRYKVSNRIREIPTIIYYHRALELFQKLVMDSVGILLPVAHWIVIKLCLYSQVTLILKWHQLDKLTIAMLMFCWTSGQSMWLFALHFCGRVMKESEKTILSWKTPLGINWGSVEDAHYMSKFRKSCKPMVINYQHLIVLKRSSILKFLKTVCRGTLRALLMMSAERNNRSQIAF